MSKKELKEMRKVEEMRRMNLEKKANMTKWIAIGVISTLFIGLFLFLVGYLRGSNPSLTDPSADGKPVELSSEGEYRVAAESTTPAQERPIILTEFADMQCPACGQYHPIVKSLLELYPETVSLQFKHFPISSIHPNAIASAVAVEAAGNQGKFFEMVDLLYERQQAWSNLPSPQDMFIEYAGELGLDVNKFTSDINDKALEEKIDNQRTEGINAGVNSTPSFFVNGVKITNPSDISGFQVAIDAELERISGGTESAPETETDATPSAQDANAPQINL